MTNYKLLVKGLGAHVNVRLTGGSSDEKYTFTLHRDQTEIASSSKTHVPGWSSPQGMEAGKYYFTCIVQSDTSEVEVTSQPFDFGVNKQEIRPRALKKRPVHQPPASFHSLLFWESRKAFAHRKSSAWLLDDKLNTYAFAAKLGLDTPALELTSCGHEELPLEKNTVVKPLTGVMSQGVFLITEEKIIDLVNSRTLSSVDELRRSMRDLVRSGAIRRDEWIRERLILDDKNQGQPARDIKFYTFYGQPLLALETVRIPDVKRCWYDNYSNLIDTGKYTNDLFLGQGIPPEFYNIAEKIGQEIPAPFVRVDLLASPTGAFVNEITPKPGGAHLFAQSMDNTLGNYLVSADARLRADLISGKEFRHFKSIQSDYSIDV